MVHHGLLVANEDTDSIRGLLDAELLASVPAPTMLMIDAVGDPGLTELADSVYAARRDGIAGAGSGNLWFMVHWAARRGYHEDTSSIADMLIARSQSGTRQDVLFGEVGRALLSLAEGDRAAAIRGLEALRPSATIQGLVWNPWEALVLERLLLARLLIESGDVARARAILAEMPSHRSIMEPWLSAERERLLDRIEPVAP
jgi:hypothetical protein